MLTCWPPAVRLSVIGWWLCVERECRLESIDSGRRNEPNKTREKRQNKALVHTPGEYYSCREVTGRDDLIKYLDKALSHIPEVDDSYSYEAAVEIGRAHV